MRVKLFEIALANHIAAASATRPVLRIPSAVVFVSAVALVACQSGKPEETPSITFTKIPPAGQGAGNESTRSLDGSETLDQSSRLSFMHTAGHRGCRPGRLTSEVDGD
jgi:hypothetical protein